MQPESTLINNNDGREVSELNNKTKLRNKWYRFQVLTSTSAILRGSYSMNAKHFKFGSRRQQASPCSTVAIVFGRLFEPKDWTTNHVDQILEHGDKLFRISQTRNRVRHDFYMTPSMVYPEFFIEDYKCLICTKQSGIFGNLFSETVGCPDFTDGLQRFFKLNDSGIITAQGASVAMWRHPKHNFLYFDPSSCSETGARSPEGAACIMRFKCLTDMRELFLSNLNKKFDSRYCIDKVTVLRVTPINRGVAPEGQFVVDKSVLRSINPIDLNEKSLDCTKVIPKGEKKTTAAVITKEPLSITISNYSIDTRFATEPLVDQSSFDTGYPYYNMEINIPSTFKELPGDLAILHGWTHESSDIYKGKGAQNVANCVMAIGMKKVYPVRTWLRPKLDEILTLGDSLYAEVKAVKPSMKSMTAADLNDTKIMIEGRTLFVDVDLITVVGTLSSKLPSILNLKQALEEFFLVNKDGMIECSSMAVAVWTQDDCFYMFDPRQCDVEGVRVVEEKGTRGKTKKKDIGPEKKKVEGRSCVMRFPNINSLVAHFLKSVDPAKKNDRFIIRHITVVDDVPGTRAWCDFQPGEAGRTWVLLGSLSNESDELGDESQGIQGIAMPVIALIKAQDVPPNAWARETVDEAIREGDEYYNWCIPPEDEEEVELTLRNLKKHLYIKNRKIKINVEESSVVGDLKVTGDAQLSDLETGIARFFNEHQYGIVEAKDLAVGIWKFDEEQKVKGKSPKEAIKETAYYCFDPNPRGKLGQRSPEDEDEPAACVIRALDPSELARRIQMNVNPSAEGTDEFFIHKFKVESICESMTDEDIQLDKQTPVKPDLNVYTELNDDGAYLTASFDQRNPTHFKPRTRNKQQAANALVTLAMSKLYNPHLWYREVLDDILKLGDKITQDNVDNLPVEEEEEEEKIPEPLRDYLLPSEIEESFDIGVNRVTVLLEESLTTAPAAELDNNLREFFTENSMGILRQNNEMLPIWKEGNIYFTMDPRGRDSRGEDDGFATVLWFTNISSLAARIQQSIAQPEDNITIDAVRLENEYETRVAENQRLRKTTSAEDLWHHFPKKSDGVWELVGNVSTKDERFQEENRGKQSAAVALIAVIFSKAYEPRLWTPEVLDEVIITGDKLHAKSVVRLGDDSSPRVNQIISEFFLSNRRLDLTITDCVQAGHIQGKPPKIQDLTTGLVNFFNDYISGVMTVAKDVNIAIWKSKNHYYCLIPDSLLPGDEDSIKKPCLIRFRAIKLMADHLSSLVDNEGDYEIHAVNVTNWNKLPPWKFDPSPAIRPSNLPPLNAFKPLSGAARAILRAGIHQGSDIFPDVIKNRQTAANCVVALGMSLIKTPITWTKKTLEDILVIGCNVHRESLKTRLTKEKLKPPDIIRVFRVGVNVLTADIESVTVSGLVANPPPEPEVKGKKKSKKPARAKGKKKKQRREPPAPPAPPILLDEGLRKFFEDNRAGILVTGRFMVALWKDQGVYFMFDPRARNDQGLEDEHGVACIMWFACMEPFYDTIFANIDESEKYGSFVICRAIVRTTIIEPLPCPAGFQPVMDCMEAPIPVTGIKKTVTVDLETLTQFFQVDEELSVLLGTTHMRDPAFDVKTRGLQSTAVAAVAIVVGLLHVPSTWTPDLIDCVLKYGDILHKDSARMTRSGARTLSPSELLTVFVVGDFKVHIHIHRHTTAGILLVHDLAQALTLFFRNNCAGILHTRNVAVAVMQHYGRFYMFDSEECDKSGRSSYDGAACVIKCENIMRLASLFVNNCNYKVPCVYTLNAVNVFRLQFFSDTRSDCSPRCEK